MLYEHFDYNPTAFLVCVYKWEWKNKNMNDMLFCLQETYSKGDNARKYYMKEWKVY